MSSTLLADHRRTASLRGKGHGCNTCGGWIAPGQTYIDQRLADGGRVWTHREHETCWSIYWAVHRDAGLHEDEIVSWDAIRDVMAGLVAWMGARGAA